jgi:hypothetical protein
MPYQRARPATDDSGDDTVDHAALTAIANAAINLVAPDDLGMLDTFDGEVRDRIGKARPDITLGAARILLNTAADKAIAWGRKQTTSSDSVNDATDGINVVVNVAVAVVEDPSLLAAVENEDPDGIAAILAKSWPNDIGAYFVAEALADQAIADAWEALGA